VGQTASSTAPGTIWHFDSDLLARNQIASFSYYKGTWGHSFPKLEVSSAGDILVASRDWGIYQVEQSASAPATLRRIVNGATVACSTGNVNSLVALPDGRIAWGGDNSDGLPRVWSPDG